jgi:hypothetical protein
MSMLLKARRGRGTGEMVEPAETGEAGDGKEERSRKKKCSAV